MSYESLLSNFSDNDSIVDYNGGHTFPGYEDNSRLQVHLGPIPSTSALDPDHWFNIQYRPDLTFSFQPQSQPQYPRIANHAPNPYGFSDMGSSSSDQNLPQAPGLGDATNYQRQRFNPYLRPTSMNRTHRQDQNYSQLPFTNPFMQDWQSLQNGPMNPNMGLWRDNDQAQMGQYPAQFPSTSSNVLGPAPAAAPSQVPEGSIGPHRRQRLQDLNSPVPAPTRAPSQTPEVSTGPHHKSRGRKQKQKKGARQTPTTDAQTAGPSTGGNATPLNDSIEGLLTDKEYSALRADSQAMVCWMQMQNPSSVDSSTSYTPCGASFHDPALAAVHLTLVHSITTKKARDVVATRCTWENCKGSTVNKRPLIKGIHRHVMEKHFHLRHRCPIRECLSTYTRTPQLKAHLESEHKRTIADKPGLMYAILKDVSKPRL